MEIKLRNKYIGNWNEEEVEQWFSANYTEFASQFRKLNGNDLTRLTIEELQNKIGTIQGRSLYITIQSYKLGK